jgi:hypothetical protein
MLLSESALRNLACLLSKEDRMKLFRNLCDIIGQRVPERVSLATGIRKTDVYRYLPKSKSRRGGLVPNPDTTVKVIKALLDNGGIESVVIALDQVGNEMRTSYLEYFAWARNLRKQNIIDNPLSDEEIAKLVKSTRHEGF